MLLVIDYNIKNAEFWLFNEKLDGSGPSHFIKDAEAIRDAGALKRCINEIAGKSRIRAVAFRILFGGDYFSAPAMIDPKFFTNFAKLTGFFPFYVPATLHMLKIFQSVFKGVPLIAFFETSFFCKLPDEEKYYAIPFEYCRDDKIKKWGFHGIFHEANAGIFPATDKTISIVFGKQTTVCSIHNRKPLSISLGYTPLEGVMSRTACGDLDPGIVFYLMNVHKFSIYKIDEMLKNKSGFLGLTGYDIGLKDILKLHGRDAKVDLALDVYRSQIMKHMGEGLSVMGGIDNIVVSGDNVDLFIPVIHDMIKKISFLGINVAGLPWRKDKDIVEISSGESRIKVYINRMDAARVIFHESRHFLGRG